LSKNKSGLVRIDSLLRQKVKIAAAKAKVSMKDWIDDAVMTRLERGILARQASKRSSGEAA
jgi:predicted HicB family RNase H-like nuclease